MSNKIAFGTTLLDRGLLGSGIDGIGQYCQELLKYFSRNLQGFDISTYSFGVEESLSNAQLLPPYTAYVTRSLLCPGSSSSANKYFSSVDLIHCTDQLIPIVSNKPLVATVMDTIPLSHPQFLKAQSRILKPLLWKKLTGRANHIITISEFSKKEIIDLMGFPEERITSIPLGVDERYFEKIPKNEISDALSKLKVSTPFFLFIGSIQPRKNLLRILKAHSDLPQNLASQFPLVIAGKLAWDDGRTLKAIHQGILGKRCIWLNYVGDFEKRCLLQSTSGLVFTSLYEGFGLPIIEAFASQAPVITSNCTSMPEVAGDAALIVDPLNTESITSALIYLIENPDKGEQLKLLGLEKAKKYTWERVARATRAVYLGL
jgi:alpha-1,3-rhamnosyl/mannosyltransferase